MASKNHSEASVLSRHPVHGVSEFADTTARNAHTYTALDIGKVVQTGTGAARRYWLIYDVVAGVASFKEVGVEVAFAAPSTLVVGGSNTQGVSTSSARADHVHALPAFGTTAGTFAQGNDARFNGVGGIQMWHADAPPLSPHACDDEMDGTSSATWSVFDRSGLFTQAMDTTNKMWSILQPLSVGTATSRVAGRLQAAPASEMAIYAKVHSVAHFSSGAALAWDCGILLAQGTGATDDLCLLGAYQFDGTASQVGMRGRLYSAFGAAGGDITNSSNQDPRPYVRVRFNGTALFFDSSPDGKSWFRQANTTLGYTPSQIGLGAALAISGSPTNVPAAAYFKFFRVFSGSGASGFNATSIGRYV